jgi:tetratricopeptide (TPR) repeat protein
MKNSIKIALLFTISLLVACNDFLDEKPNLNLVVPASLDDFQGLLDAYPRGMNSYPTNGLISSDEVVMGSSTLSRLNFNFQALYFWEEETSLPGEQDFHWLISYTKIMYANVVLDGLNEYRPANEGEEQRMLNLEAQAKFYRAQGHYELLMHYGQVGIGAGEEALGIPIRKTSDINVKNQRASIGECFDFILEDLLFAADQLEMKVEIPMRPSKWAAEAMLGRVYLNRGDYPNSFQHSSNALGIDGTLMDYKELDNSLPFSFETFNPEVIFHQEISFVGFEFDQGFIVNPDLVAEYDSLDLRKNFFFRSNGIEDEVNFRGNYTGDFYHFGGLATDEVWLNFAEAAFRVGQEETALEAINVLLEHRMDAGFEPVSGLTGIALLQRIVLERQKELVFRGIRWIDLKRFNQDPDLAITLRRKFNEIDATLPPNDSRYVFLIPEEELEQNPIIQNQR